MCGMRTARRMRSFLFLTAPFLPKVFLYGEDVHQRCNFLTGAQESIFAFLPAIPHLMIGVPKTRANITLTLIRDLFCKINISLLQLRSRARLTLRLQTFQTLQKLQNKPVRPKKFGRIFCSSPLNRTDPVLYYTQEVIIWSLKNETAEWS